MKRTERRHLKDNELANLAQRSRRVVEERSGQVTAVIVALAVIAAAAIGYYAWRSSVQGRAHALLAEAMTVQEAPVGPATDPDAPDKGLRFSSEHEKAQALLTKLKVVADEYPSTDAGVLARYREGATWMALDGPSQAATAFQSVIDRAGNSIFGQMARLGLAEAQARTGQFDQAIATYKELAERKDSQLPVDGILMQLARTYLNAGKQTDAQQTLNRLVQEFPESQFTAEARQQLDSLKKT
jgi:tetratricopeptide (TPR) repeat protein